MRIYIFPFHLFPKRKPRPFDKIHLQYFPADIDLKLIQPQFPCRIHHCAVRRKYPLKQFFVIPVPYPVALFVIDHRQRHDHLRRFPCSVQRSCDPFHIFRHQPVITVQKRHIRRFHRPQSCIPGTTLPFILLMDIPDPVRMPHGISLPDLPRPIRGTVIHDHDPIPAVRLPEDTVKCSFQCFLRIIRRNHKSNHCFHPDLSISVLHQRFINST